MAEVLTQNEATIFKTTPILADILENQQIQDRKEWIQTRLKMDKPPSTPQSASMSTTTEPTTPLRTVFLLENDEKIHPVLAAALRRQGFNLHSFQHPDAMLEALTQTKPLAILLEKLCLDNNNVHIECHQKLAKLKIPTTLISEDGDMASRLQATRLGIEHFLTRPINIETLLEILDQYANTEQAAPYRVLIVDDDQLLASLYELTLKNAGFNVMTQFSARNIVEVLREFKPELIFMDVQMPDCSGPEAAAVIRQIPDFNVIPIVFLSGDTDLNLQLAALTQGGDDFLTKPIDQEHMVVTATARAARARGLQQTQQRLRQTAAELKSYQENAEHEQKIAQELMSRMIFSEDLADETMQFWHQPASRFSGDLVAAMRDNSNRLYILHADAMGHGLPAALPLLPVSQTFYAMAKQGFTIGAIAATMNAQLRTQIPIGNFVACTLLVIDRNNFTVEVWKGGSPNTLFINRAGDIIKQFNSQHTSLGVSPKEDFSSDTELYQWNEAGHLALFSDGLPEASNKAGKDFSSQLESAFSKPLTTADDDRLQPVVENLSKHLEGEVAHDDISIVVIRCAR